MKFFLYDETMKNTKAKITTEKLSAMSDIVSQKAQYITAAGAATPNQITIAAGVLIAVGSSVFKTVLTNLTTANLDTGSGFEMGTDYYIYCCDPTNGSDTVDRDEVFVISKNSTYPSKYTADNSFHGRIECNDEPVSRSIQEPDRFIQTVRRRDRILPD